MQRPLFQPRSCSDILCSKAIVPTANNATRPVDSAARSAIDRVASSQDHVANALAQVHLIGNYVADINSAGNCEMEDSKVRVINVGDSTSSMQSTINRRQSSTCATNSTERINALHNFAKVYADRAKVRENNEIKKFNSRRKSFINKISEKIVMKKELLEGETTESRLSRSTGNIRDETHADINNKLTFQPILAKSTHTIFMNSKFNQYNISTNKISNVHSRSQKWIEDKNIKLQREKEFMDREIEKELTFRPCVSKRPSVAAPTGVVKDAEKQGYEDNFGPVSHITEDTTSLSARNVSWMRKREERLQIERRRKENDELKDCTFAPNTSHKPQQKKKVEKKYRLTPSRNSPIPSPPPMIETVFTGINRYDALNEEDFLREYESYLTNVG